jgi:beta-fructofuranosidase
MTAAPTFPDNKEGVLDSRAFYAGKTASNGTDRYIWGWCPTRAGNDNTAVGAAPAEPEWAGNLVMHKIIQHEDGTLSLGSVDGILNKYTNNTTLKVMAQSETGVAESNDNYTLSGDAYVLFNRLNIHNKLTFTVTASSNEDIFGISLARGTDSKKYYSLIINPEDNNSNRKINFEQKGKEGIGFIAGIDGYKFPVPADNIYHVTICTDNSVCTVYINDNVAYTNRIYGIQKNCWSLDSYEGSIQVSNIKVSYY